MYIIFCNIKKSCFLIFKNLYSIPLRQESTVHFQAALKNQIRENKRLKFSRKRTISKKKDSVSCQYNDYKQLSGVYRLYTSASKKFFWCAWLAEFTLFYLFFIQRKVFKSVADDWSSLKSKSVKECVHAYLHLAHAVPLFGSRLFKAQVRNINRSVDAKLSFNFNLLFLALSLFSFDIYYIDLFLPISNILRTISSPIPTLFKLDILYRCFWTFFEFWCIGETSEHGNQRTTINHLDCCWRGKTTDTLKRSGKHRNSLFEFIQIEKKYFKR